MREVDGWSWMDDAFVEKHERANAFGGDALDAAFLNIIIADA